MWSWDEVDELCVDRRMHAKGMEGEQSSVSAQGGKQERVEKLSTRGNYYCSVQVVYDGVKRENKWMCGREWHARRYTGGFRMGRRTEDNFLC